MADVTYDNIDRPYATDLTRSATYSTSNAASADISQDAGGRTILSGSALTDAWIDTWLKSDGYSPKKRGFLIDGQSGYIECMKLWVGNGGIVGGALDIPDLITPASFHVDAAGNLWSGATTLALAQVDKFAVTNDGTLYAYKGIIGGTLTVGGTLATTIGGAINASGDFINELVNAQFDTSTKQILSDFTFGVSGAIRMNTDASNGLWISPNGLLGKKAGVTTFSIDTSGNASFRGDVVITGGSGYSNLTDKPTLGSISSLNSIGASNCNSTIISGGKIITGLLTADNIQTGTLTGLLIQNSNAALTGVKMSASLGGIVIYDQSLYIKNSSDQTLGYLYPNFSASPPNSGSNWRLGLVNAAGIDTIIGAGTNIVLSSTFVVPTNDNTMYLGASTTSAGGGRTADWTWKYIGGQVIDAKVEYRINNYICIDQFGSDVIFCGGGSLYMQGTIGTNDIKCTYNAVTLYHDTQVQGTITSTSDHITISGTSYYGTTGAYNSAKYYLRTL